MDGNVRLSATVISCMGNAAEKDDFYFNGNFSNCHNTQSIQFSFEKAANNYIFAISDSLGLESSESDGISAIREIKKYHESAKLQQFSLETVSERIYEAVQLSSNLIYSKSVIASQSPSRLTGFSSLIIDNNRAAIMNLGNNGAFLFRQGEQKELFGRNYGRKSEKLKSLGITPTGPDFYNDTEKILKLAEEESKTKIKLSPSFELEEEDVIILCSDGLLNGVSKGRLEAISDSGFEPSKMASVLYHEALKNGLDDGITVMVIKVEEIRSLAFGYGSRKANYSEYDNEPEAEEEEERSGSSIVNYILGFVCVLVISGVLFMGYLIFTNSDIFGSDKDNTAQGSTATGSSYDSSGPEQSDNTASDASDAEETSGITQEDSQGSGQGDGQEPGKNSSSASNSSSDGKGSQGNQQSSSGNSSGNSSQTDGNQNGNTEYDIYVVKSGDTLSAISNKFYGNMNKYNIIMEYNGIKKDNSLYVGQELKIPKLK
ncbi:LysM domain/BON superfamily protein [Ruminiclostridium hungatei]|uniref:LysM domain/BON superfamily protein n=1 Tax=Ruminiclostridium hungatei TaxID=48256 RepID=A0A1V4SIM2_RUMHU|nr:LysM peptidoglycan-binding domain-containing protein [Ruminiclostridium hungatei]OPX43097.1 LysM domain/BON superfamily protein [Ruminiclostridium hungatei]